MVYTAAEDLVTLLVANFVHTNVGTISADPTIKLQSLYDQTSHPDNGLIIVEDETLSRIAKGGQYRQEVYTIKVSVTYYDTTSTVLKKIVAEMDRLFNANNISPSRSYEYEIFFDWNTGVLDGTVDLLVETKTIWTAVAT